MRHFIIDEQGGTGGWNCSLTVALKRRCQRPVVAVETMVRTGNTGQIDKHRSRPENFVQKGHRRLPCDFSRGFVALHARPQSTATFNGLQVSLAAKALT